MKKLIFLFLIMLLYGTYGFSQSQDMQGKVVSQDGSPLPGATVTATKANKSTVTDANGEFSLPVSGSDSLTVSYIGFETAHIPIQAGENPIITLTASVGSLNELVVTGYQKERKKDLTGAVSVVDMKDIKNIPTGNIMSALEGRVPGMHVTTDGTPGGVGTGVTIRGITTINNSTPLYIIDGVQTRSNLATLLNSDDIESIQVLKDAASASIYGTKAANGVVIITTKKARPNQMVVNFNAQLTTQQFYTGIKLLNTKQWGEIYWKAYENDGIKPNSPIYGNGDKPVIPKFIDSKKTIPSGNTNWADEVYKNALLQNYTLRVSKGTQNGSSTISFNYFDQDGLVKYTNFTRFNVGINSRYNFLNNRLRIGENVKINQWNEIIQPDGIEELVIKQLPIIPVYDVYGGYAGPTQGLGDSPNPVRLLDQVKSDRHKHWSIFGDLFIEVEPIKNLRIKSQFGLNYQNSFNSSFQPKWHEGTRTVDKNSLDVKSDYARDWTWSNTATYHLNLGKHSFHALIGMEAQESQTEWLEGYREDFLIEALDYRYLSAGNGKQTNGNLASRTAMVSYFGKLNYSYMDRYLISATLRRDASSRFGKNDNAALFPAISGGWRISQEGFFKDINFISDLKLRASWGKNGNDLIDNEATYTKYETNLTTAGYDINGNNQGVIPSGIVKVRTGNPNIRWEITTQTDMGIDLTMFDHKLAMTLDYYLKNTKDMLIDRPYIAIIGEGGYMAYNGASLKNDGIEGSITWRNNAGRDFNYKISFVYSAYKNKVTSLPEDIYYTWGGGNGTDKSIVGQPLGSWMGYKTNGLYRTKNELDDGIDQPGKGLGRIRYLDINGDGVINSDDRTWLGTDQPKFSGGLNLSISYKMFDFSFFLSGMVRDAYNNSKFYTDFFQLWTGNHGVRLLKAWNEEDNFNSSIPALTAQNLNDEGRTSEYFIENGSYMRMKNMQLGYTVPKNITDRLKMNSLRIYLQTQNLFTITKYTGADPEGLGYPYPLPRSFTFGINMEF